jgi:cytochrome c oxidase assembly factor CtaG
VDLKLPGHPVAAPRRPSRPWLAAVGAALVVICLVPPLSVLARRYLFVESIQFCVFAMVAPALVVLGAPWPLVRGWPAADRLARRLARARRRRASFVPVLGYLAAWAALCLCWRLPPVLDGVARHPVLVVPEAVTLGAAGTALWLELVPSPPLAPRLGRPQRTLIALLAMWFTWAVAYVLGFAGHAVVSAYDGAGSHLTTVADQEITVFLVWAVTGACFLPVVVLMGLTWLKEGTDAAGGTPRPAAPAGVKGWGWSAGQGRRRHVGGQ